MKASELTTIQIELHIKRINSYSELKAKVLINTVHNLVFEISSLIKNRRAELESLDNEIRHYQSKIELMRRFAEVLDEQASLEKKLANQKNKNNSLLARHKAKRSDINLWCRAKKAKNKTCRV